MFGVVPKVIWQKHYPADEKNLCNWALRSILVDSGERVALVDNGYGDKQSEKYMSFVHLNGGDGLMGGLEKHGYSPDDITDMVLTHLHADHCGGGVRYNADRTGFELVFPNATYWVSRVQWESAMNPNQREKDGFLEENILPMMESGRLRFIDEGTTLFPGFEVRLYHGHTSGQVIPFIQYKGRTIVFTADLIPSTVHIPLAYNMAYDMEPMATLTEKESFLEEALENDYILFFQHDLYHECCTLQRTPKGIRVDQTFTLQDLDGLKTA
jgi:glyoxylase-like metal-dependent hydrolase (beta-lactamase superfamily II)